ncbi:MAG: ATP-binding cassette domain-containing protein, partial [Eubacteriales bacterium]|nr:ATP-binding cassette domain-containing protein [Eubacteriales bacterium]
MLQLEHLKKSYNKTEILKDISYTFNKGQLYPVLGGQGAGRTTLLECINGDLPLDSGEIIIKEKGKIFLASKQSVLPMYITGYEFIEMLCDMGRKTREPEYYFGKVRLSEDARDMLICDYSFEEKKRLQLAAFLVQKPYVMMFDEPLDYCTEEYISDFLNVVEAMKDDHIIIITTGLLDISQRISDDALVLNNGELNVVSKETMEIPEIKQAVM